MNLKNNRGLTLLEIIIAITLSIVILLILFSAMRLGYKSRQSGDNKAEETQKIRIIGDRITWLIRGAFPFFAIGDTTERTLYFKGEEDRIGFVTTSVDVYEKGPEDIAGLKWVSIFLEDGNLMIREKVFFMDDVFDDSGGKEFILLPEVETLEFKYFDIPDDEEQGEWISEWEQDEKEYIPVAVKVNISFKHKDKTVDMPEIIVKINATNK